ncbi:hypothetical protein BD410DRAFT_896296 [Rickenella mellea]|uniref:SET domain-containing protein n=1 Tax=Rickenella mellea TaxID=50990 RepID=A0A4Y7QCK4_9AGAM|nr:hypothetical protein BD410DRAFT_896296 [Rickenella mellea]
MAETPRDYNAEAAAIRLRFLQSLSDIPFLSDALRPLTSNSSTDSESCFDDLEGILQNPTAERLSMKMCKEAIEMHLEFLETERTQPPTKISSPSRSRVCSLLSRNRVENEKADILRHGVAHYNTFIDSHREFSRKSPEDLQPLLISSMLAPKRHEGFYLLCRTITEPSGSSAYVHTPLLLTKLPKVRQVSITIGIEDVEGSAGIVVISNFPTLTFATPDELDVVCPLGTIIAVREPVYKFSEGDDMPFIRVHSPSDVVFLTSTSDILRGLTWSSDAIAPLPPTPRPSVEGWRLLGISQFKAQHWLAAAISFTHGLSLDPQAHVLRLNRSECYLRLGWFVSALHDSKHALLSGEILDDKLIGKAVFRTAKVLYRLGRYSEALEMAKRRPDDEDCKPWISRSSDRLLEQSTSCYNWKDIFLTSQDPSADIDVAEFTGPIEVRKSEGMGGGRGVFVTRSVQVGELLIVSKPISLIYTRKLPEKEAFTALYSSDTDTGDPNAASVIGALYAGSGSEPHSYPPPPPPPPQHPSDDVKSTGYSFRSCSDIDMAMIEHVCTLDGVGIIPLAKARPAPESTGSSIADLRAVGIYPLPSLCNHSCIPTSNRVFFGDVLVIRASRNLKKGEELTVQYVPGELPFTERQERLSKFDFVCYCPLCTADRADGDDAPRIRNRIWSKFDKVASKNPKGPTFRRALKFTHDMEQTFRDTDERRMCRNVNPMLSNLYHRLAALYCRRWRDHERPMEASLEAFMKALEALGIVVLDKSITGRIKRQGQLPIDTSAAPSHSIEECVKMVLTMCDNFLIMDEDQRAESWMKAAVFLERVLTGGGSDLFRLRYQLVLEGLSSEVNDFAQSILND